jgi:hypothetical protein
MASLQRIRTTNGFVIILLALMGWFYFWTAVPVWRPELISADGPGYYNLLARGFLKGQLALDKAADPFLATLSDPTDPAQRAGHGMFDVSYFKGRYYLYWGATPAVVLFVPFYLLTGRFLDESLAPPLFAWLGLIAAVWLVLRVKRRYFPNVSAAMELGCVLALGLANMMPALLRRSSVYEAPITSGYACCMLGLAALFHALQARRKTISLAIAGTLFGWAVGSRPFYLFSSLGLAVVVWQLAQSRGLGLGAWRNGPWRRWVLAAILPLLAAGIALATYNYLRFGSPTDFGLRHQMTGDRITHLPYFGWSFLLYNLRVYGFAGAGWSPYFPFVQPADLPKYPEGNLGYEDPYGILVNIPFVLFAAGLLIPGAASRAQAIFRSVLLAAAGTGIPLLCFGSATNRYMVDFLPALIVLACFGLLSIAARLQANRLTRNVAAIGVVGVIVYSTAFNVFASFAHNDILRNDHPSLYHDVARAWNWPSHLFDRITGKRYGPIELTVKFAEHPTQSMEPLVTTGRSVLSDYLVVHYLEKNRIQFGLEHTSRGSFFGAPFTLQPGETHVLRIDMGSLYPPAQHPYFNGMPRSEAEQLQKTLRVTCDGLIVLDRRIRFYDATSHQPSIGVTEDRPAFKQPFSGKIISTKRLAVAATPAADYGAVQFELLFPDFTASRNEPLLSAGETGRGDLIYVRYEGPRSISFGYDHWGYGGAHGTLMSFDPAQPQVVTIDYEGLHPPLSNPPVGSQQNGKLIIRLNGKIALDTAVSYYQSPPDTVSLGFNAIGASTATPEFSGEIIKTSRLAEPPLTNQ